VDLALGRPLSSASSPTEECALDHTMRGWVIRSLAQGAQEMPTVEDFSNELFRMMAEAGKAGNEFVEVEAGELHRRVGGYPGRDHRMPNCCRVMREQIALDYGDAVISEPPSGQGASLTIRYRLPRLERVDL
jgi:hypothetical protein